LVKSIETMTVADLAEFVKILEDKFGVSAAAPMMMAGAPAAAGAAEAAEEKTSFTVMLKDGGAQKIAVIKAVREINQDLGLVDAKNLVEAAPKEVKKDLPKDEAEEAKKKLEAAGATVELV
jgi:large subunit ribosomal protein L7/L12